MRWGAGPKDRATPHSCSRAPPARGEALGGRRTLLASGLFAEGGRAFTGRTEKEAPASPRLMDVPDETHAVVSMNI